MKKRLWHLLDAMEQGSDHTIADGGTALRAGQKAVMGEIPCHGDVFHIQHQCQTVVSQSSGKCNCPKASPEQEMVVAKQKAQGNRVSKS